MKIAIGQSWVERKRVKRFRKERRDSKFLSE